MAASLKRLIRQGRCGVVILLSKVLKTKPNYSGANVLAMTP